MATITLNVGGDLNTTQLNCGGITIDGYTTLSTGSSVNTLTLPSSTDTLVARNTTDTLENKTIGISTNTVAASAIQGVSISASAPSTGQALITTSSSAAGWSPINFASTSYTLTGGNGTTLSITTGSHVAINLRLTTGPPSWYNNSAGCITSGAPTLYNAPSTGYYSFSTSVAFGGTVTSSTQIAVVLSGSVTGAIIETYEPWNISGQILGCSIACLFMTAGDTMSVQLYQNSGSTQNGFNLLHFSAVRLF